MRHRWTIGYLFVFRSASVFGFQAKAGVSRCSRISYPEGILLPASQQHTLIAVEQQRPQGCRTICVTKTATASSTTRKTLGAESKLGGSDDLKKPLYEKEEGSYNSTNTEVMEGEIAAVVPGGVVDAVVVVDEKSPTDSAAEATGRGNLWQRTLRYLKGNKDGLTFRQRLAKMGLAVLLSYGWVSNMSYCICVSMAWYVFAKQVSFLLSKDRPGSTPKVSQYVCPGARGGPRKRFLL